MKFTVRNGVWETNSSSMHSIAVTKTDEKYAQEEMLSDLWVDKNGTWNLKYRSEDLNFGRFPFQVLTTFAEKVKYVIASKGYYWHGTYQKVSHEMEILLELITEICPAIKNIRWPTQYETAYRDQEGNELDYDDLHYEYGDGLGYHYIKDGKKYPAVKDDDYEVELNYYGDIDHQSSGLLEGFLKKEGITLKDFLSKKKYIVIIDGDEYCSWNTYKAAKIINIDYIDHEFPPVVNGYHTSYDSYEYFKKKEDRAECE